MSTNNSQNAHIPLEALSENNDNESNIDELLSVQIITTSQSSSSSSMPFNTTNMIPSQIPTISNSPEQNNLNLRQEGRRRRRRRQRQRRRERQEALRRRQQQQEDERRQLQRQHPHQQQQRHYREQTRQIRPQRYEQWQEHQQQNEQRRQYGQRRQHHNDMWHQLDSFDEFMDRNYTEPLLEVYDWEKMDPKERWEQEQVNELEGFVVLEQLALIQDELEQLKQIDAIQKMQEETEEEQQQERNNEELIQLNQWEHVAFFVQQLNQN